MTASSASATSELLDAGDEQRKRCVSCNISKPRDGKLLHCLHVICFSCLCDSIREAGCVKCSLCGDSTESKRPVDLSKQLADSRPVLYSNSTVHESVRSHSTADAQKWEVSESLDCEMCADTGSARAATHRCHDCDMELMCESHAQRHMTRARFAGHRIAPVAGGASSNNAAAEGETRKLKEKVHLHCPLHVKHVLVKFCHTCQYSVCEQCLATAHHLEHDVQTTVEAADRLRSLLKERDSALLESAASTGASASQAIDGESWSTSLNAGRIQELSTEIEKVLESATEASLVATEKFEKVKKMVEEWEAAVLDDINKKSWKLVEPLQKQQQRLRILQQKQATSAELSIYLSSAESLDDEVLQLSHVVDEKLRAVPTEIRKEVEDNSYIGGRIIADAKESLSDLERVVESLVAVHAIKVDLLASEISVPKLVTMNKDSMFTLKLYDCLTEAPVILRGYPAVSCTVVSPSGGRSSACIKCRNEGSVENVLEVSVHPLETGRHCLEIRCAGNSRTVDFESQDSFVVKPSLDPGKCSGRIRLSNGNRTASIVSQGHSTVLSMEGYSAAGEYQWSVKITNCGILNYYMGAGVTVASNGSGYDVEFLSKSGHWKSNGSSVPSGVNTCAWQNGDILTFTLDCVAKTLELHHHRSDQRKVIRNLDCSEPLYPAIYLYKPGHEAEFI